MQDEVAEAKTSDSELTRSFITYRGDDGNPITVLVRDDSYWKSIQYDDTARSWHLWSTDNRELLTIPSESVLSVRTWYSQPISTPHAPLDDHLPHDRTTGRSQRVRRRR